MTDIAVTLETSASTAALDDALAKAQGEIETADKDKVNPAFRTKYADLTSVWAACRPALTKHGIALTQWPLASADNRLHIVTRIAHKGEWMQARFSLPVDKANAHGVGSAITYAKRFTLSAALGIVADDDDDGNAASKASRANGAPKEEAPQRVGQSAEPRGLPHVDPLDHGLIKGDGRSAYQMATADKSPGRIVAEGWTKDILGMIRLPGYDALNWREWGDLPYQNTKKTNRQKLAEMREKHSDLGQQIDDAVADLPVPVTMAAAHNTILASG